MARPELIILLAAEQGIQSIFELLEERRDGLGNEFLSAMGQAFRRLEEQPEIGPQFTRGYRRLLLRAYHLGIFYRIEGRRLVVAHVLDLRQDPMTILRLLGR